MKINAISTPKFVKTLAILSPLFVTGASMQMKAGEPKKDEFIKTEIVETENSKRSPEIQVGNYTINPTIVVDKSENTLYFYNSEGYLDSTFPVGLGKQSTPTQVGVRVITGIEDYPYKKAPASTKRRKNPNDYGPKVICLASVDTKTGKIIGSNGQFIHGTKNPDSVGKNFSKGCMRMNNEEVKNLASRVSKGQYVLIKE